jgi:hypothetical protein
MAAMDMVSNLPEHHWNDRRIAQLVERPSYTGEVVGSTPAPPTMLLAVCGFEASFAKRSFPSRCPCAKKG